MTALLALATSRIGLLVIAFASIIIFYEGVPIGPLRWIPFVGPVLEEVVDGRVDRERKRALEGYVRQAELDAEKAESRELRRRLAAAREATEGFQTLLEEAQQRERDLAVQDAQEDADYEAKLKAAGRDRPLTDDDIDYVVRKPAKAP